MPGQGRVANRSEDSNQKLVTLGAHVVRARVASSNTRLPAMERGGARALKAAGRPGRTLRATLIDALKIVERAGPSEL